jgi:flagellar export protein FliJ
MKKFIFPLESLRTLRKQRENAAQQRYARALAACDQAAAQLQEMVKELSGAWDTLVSELARGVAAQQLMSLRTWCTVLEIRRNERRAALDEARRLADAAFREMVSAARERESLDRFYEKSQTAHERSIQQEEQKNFDELAVQMSSTNSLLQLAGHEHLN